MHELSVCQSIVSQVAEIAHNNHARSVCRIDLAIGPLAGIEIHLLKQAFPLAAAGTVAEHAVINASRLALTIRCQTCGKESEAQVNRLVCDHCGDWHTQVISGDEMLITSIELETESDAESDASEIDPSPEEEPQYV